MRARGPLVLCYHAVSRAWPHSLSVPPETLVQQVRLLRRRYGPATAADALTGVRRGLHVTFDDAYRSVGSVVPALRDLGVPATVFACSDYASRPRPLAVAELAGEAAARPDELATMGWDELRELVAAGVDVGSHTVSHAHLPALSDEELRRELVDSREHIEDELGKPCPFLAYPYGEHDARVRDAARAAGYAAAFALQADGRRPDAFALPRLGVWRRDHTLRLLAKVAFAYGREPRRAP